MSRPERPAVKLTTPADIVGCVPWLIGFHPEESLVVVCLRGPRLRTGLTMRIDLPREQDEPALAAQVAVRARHDGARSVLLLCYTAAPDRDVPDGGAAVHEVLPRAALVDALVGTLGERGIGCADAILVRAGRWHSYHCDIEDCCPRGGRALPEQPTPATARLAAEAAVSGRAPLPGRADLERSVAGPVGLRGIVVEGLCERVVAGVRAEAGADAQASQARTLSLLAAALRSYEQGTPRLDDETAVRIVLGLHDKPTRDEVTTWVLDAPEEPLLALLLDLARLTPDDVCAPVCTVLAWVAHALGNGGLANVAVDRALAHQPGYTLAELVRDSLDRQVSPSELRRVSEEIRAELRRERPGA